MPRGDPQIEHLLRRTGFGAGASELRSVGQLSTAAATDFLLSYSRQRDDVDELIGDPAYANVVARNGPFSPNTNIDEARQRWLFRMVHSRRPLQEKMTLFWHNHFATAYSKIAGTYGTILATKSLALKAGELPGPQGQIELFRDGALGSFRDLLIAVARDPAMLVWLDGRLNVARRPQENFAREVMELFTFGVGHYTEEDVYAAARVFTGWNLRLVGTTDTPTSYLEFVYNASQHDATAKSFTFPIYADGAKTIPARAASAGMQDGIDFLTALARNRETARRLARKLWSFFVSEIDAPDRTTIEAAAAIYLQQDTRIEPMLRYLITSAAFSTPRNYYSRHAWPVEYVVRAIKEVGWSGFSIDTARAALPGMGQTLFEPPDVNGWEGGRAWFTTGSMLGRMNFAAALMSNQRFNLAREAGAARQSPQQLLDFLLDRLSPVAYAGDSRAELLTHLRTGATWPVNDTQLTAKTAGTSRLILGSAEYQFM